MQKITQKDLESLVKMINKKTGNTFETYTKKADKTFKANIGTYSLDFAYGGVKLVQLIDKNGGITEISRNGFSTKKELYCWLNAFLAGLETTKK